MDIFKRKLFVIVIGIMCQVELNFCIIMNNGKNHFNQFGYCLRDPDRNSLPECFGQTAVKFLQELDETENFTLDNGLILKKDESISSRSFGSLFNSDLVDVRGILENTGAILGQRTLLWHMDRIYPGLMLKIGPTADANSLLEFEIDPTMIERHNSIQEPSTARLLTKRFLLPILLGLKLNLFTLMPLLITGILLLLKKSLFLSKFLFFLSTLLTFGGLNRPFFGNVETSHGIFNDLDRHTSYFTNTYDNELNNGYLRKSRKIKLEKPKIETKFHQMDERFYNYGETDKSLGRNGNAFIDELDTNFAQWKPLDSNTKF